MEAPKCQDKDVQVSTHDPEKKNSCLITNKLFSNTKLNRYHSNSWHQRINYHQLLILKVIKIESIIENRKHKRYLKSCLSTAKNEITIRSYWNQWRKPQKLPKYIILDFKTGSPNKIKQAHSNWGIYEKFQGSTPKKNLKEVLHEKKKELSTTRQKHNQGDNSRFGSSQNGVNPRILNASCYCIPQNPRKNITWWSTSGHKCKVTMHSMHPAIVVCNSRMQTTNRVENHHNAPISQAILTDQPMVW